MKRCLIGLLATCFAAFAALPAQADTAALAAALVRAQAPATDDADATARDLVTTALAHRRSPVAWFLVQEATWLVSQLQDLRGLRELLAAVDPATRQHGLLAQKCSELRWWLDRAIDGPSRVPTPWLGYATQLLVAGPFGDAGDHFTGVLFAPELQFPALAAQLSGRGDVARVRRVERRADTHYLELAPRGRALPGCYYGLQRIGVEAAVEAFLEIEHDGDFQVFVDRGEVLRVDRWRTAAPRRHYIGLQLPPGEHAVVVKTCVNERSSLTLRWLDADGNLHAGVRELGFDETSAPMPERATPTPTPFVTASDVLARAAEQPDADAAVRLAALQVAVRDTDEDLTLRLCEPLRHAPPSEPGLALAFARVLRFVPLPDELRKAEARRLVEGALDALLPAHHTARLAKAQLLGEQDQSEQALRLLAEHPAPGPETFASRFALVQQLRFAAEHTPLLEAWAASCPRDPRPLAALANEAGAARDAQRVLAYRRRALELRLDQGSVLQAAFRTALDVGDFVLAAQWLELLAPELGEQPALARLGYQLEFATASGDEEAVPDLLRAIAAHPDVGVDWLLDLAARWTRLANPAETIVCLQRCLERDRDHTAARAWLAALGERAPEAAEFLRFHRDGEAARAALQPGEREQGASSTVLIDQRLIEFQPDGSWTSEVHEMRRINDLAGVEAFRSAGQLTTVDEVLLVRTLATDGRVYVPARIENDYAMQRLEPGACIEWRYRERGRAPGPAALSTEPFFFGSDSEPCALSELVLILPPAGRGQLRTRRLGAPTATETLPDGRTVLVFRRTDLDTLPKEQRLPPLTELVPFAEVGEDDAIFATLREHKVQLFSRTRPSAPIQAAARDIFAGLPDDRARLAAAWHWCQREIESGAGDSALQTLLRKKGSRFLLTVALLRAAGMPVSALASPEVRPELGPGDASLFASADHLHLPGAMVATGDGEPVFLCVDVPRHWPLGAVPAARAGSRAFAVHADDQWEAVILPGSADASQTLRVRGEATIEGSEVRLRATAEVGDVQGFGLADRLRELKENVQKLAARQIAQQLFPEWRVRQAQIATSTPGQPLRLEVQLSRAGVQANGDAFLVPLPIPAGRFVAAFADRAERTLPFRLVGDMITDWQIDFDSGSALRLARTPEPVSIHLPPLHYEQSCTRIGERLRLFRRYRIGAATLPAADFDAWLRALADADRADQGNLELVARAAR